MRVTFFHRRPQGANFSLERLFADVRQALPESIDAEIAVSRFKSRGLWPRLYNIIEATFRQGEINHITGDVHFLAILLRRNRTLLTIPDLVSVHRLSGLRRKIILFFWYWLPIRRSALVTVISEATKQDLLRYIKVDPRKVRVVHCCVSSALQPVPKVFNSIKPVILQIGSRQNKNVERVAEALQGIPCHLRIIGRLSDRQTDLLQRFEIEYSSVLNISDEEVVEEYHQCDMLVFASTFEGFGLPILEAQATGRAVVTSNIMSMPEVAGDAACLVDPFDVASIRSGMQKIINDTLYRDTLVKYGFDNVSRFRPEIIAVQYVEIYRELLSRCEHS